MSPITKTGTIMMISDDIEDLIYRVFSDEADAEERSIVDDWLRENERHRQLFYEMERMWHTAKYSASWGDVCKADAWNAIECKHRKVMRKRMLRVRWSVAAAAVVVLIGFSLFFFPGGDVPLEEKPAQALVGQPGGAKALLVLSSGARIELGSEGNDTIREGNLSILNTEESICYSGNREQQGKKEVYNELIVPTGGEYRLVLSDGSVVYMNSESSLKYPVHFVGEKRVVKLEGEAYFEVESDKNYPFVVMTEQLDVTVLGTGFNVMAYKEDVRTEVTLVNGNVNVNSEKTSKALIPNQQFVKYHADGKCLVRDVDAEKYTAWKSGILNYDAMPLGELSEKLSRWYGVHFSFAKEKLKYMKFTGAFKKYDDINRILELMEATMEVTFWINGKTVVVDEKIN